MDRKVQIVPSKEGTPTLYVNEIYLHSKYFPSNEAEKFIMANERLYKDKNTVLVYGIGLGYHIKELLKKAEKNCKIYIFDADVEIVNIALQLGMLEEIKKDTRVEIITNYSKGFLDKFSYVLSLVDDILIYKVSLKVLPNCYIKIKEALEDYITAKIGIEIFHGIIKENYDASLKYDYPGIKEFFKKYNFYGETIIIAASGPSLDYNLEALKKLNGKYKIFAVGSALKTLMKNEIEPFMTTIIDCQEVVYNQIKGYEKLDIPLCFLNTASQIAIEKYCGPKYMFYNESNKENVIINTGKTVAVAALDIALKGGAKRIVFVGQDLAFVDNKTHTETFTELYGKNNNVKDRGIYEKVQGIDGNLLNTTKGYLYFKRQIEKEIEENPIVTFINCSKGAKIKGTVEMKLQDLLNEF